VIKIARIIIDRGLPWRKRSRPSERELVAPIAGLFAGGVFLAAVFGGWAPPEGVNSLLVIGLFLECFSGLWLLLNPATRIARKL